MGLLVGLSYFVRHFCARSIGSTAAPSFCNFKALPRRGGLGRGHIAKVETATNSLPIPSLRAPSCIHSACLLVSPASSANDSDLPYSPCVSAGGNRSEYLLPERKVGTLRAPTFLPFRAASCSAWPDRPTSTAATCFDERAFLAERNLCRFRLQSTLIRTLFACLSTIHTPFHTLMHHIVHIFVDNFAPRLHKM
jgi:hypothetical protein